MRFEVSETKTNMGEKPVIEIGTERRLLGAFLVRNLPRGWRISMD